MITLRINNPTEVEIEDMVLYCVDSNFVLESFSVLDTFDSIYTDVATVVAEFVFEKPEDATAFKLKWSNNEIY